MVRMIIETVVIMSVVTIIHELAHAMIAKMFGFDVKGFGFDRKTGLRITTKVTYPEELKNDPKQNWKLLAVSAAGILFHGLCLIVCVFLPYSELNQLIYLVNLGSFIANLLPVKGADGQKIFMILFKYQFKGLGAYCEPGEIIKLADLKD